MKKILTIAGSDSSGGAGIQADLRVFAKHELFGLSALTVIVAMDPDNGWAHQVFSIDNDVIKAQLKTALQGVGVDVIKLGMLPTVDCIQIVAEHLAKQSLPVIFDPVMVCKGDEPLFPEHGKALAHYLLPQALITTPNLFEAAHLAGITPIKSLDDAKNAGQHIIEQGCKTVVIKGVGQLMNPKTAMDLYYDGSDFKTIDGEYIETQYTHGLGCTFAAHIASNICKGIDPYQSCQLAKEAITSGLKKSFALNQYVGTLDFSKNCE